MRRSLANQAAGVRCESAQQGSEPSAVEGVAGKSFVLTGTLPTMARSEAGQLIKQAGGKGWLAASVKKPISLSQGKRPAANSPKPKP